MINSKSLEQAATQQDGRRILLERHWPNGLDQHTEKINLKIDEWCQSAAPSIELTQWYQQQDFLTPSFEKIKQEFWRRYKQELMAHPENWMPLLDIARNTNLTLLYSGHEHLNNQHLPNDHLLNHAKMLAEFLEDELDRFNDTSSPVCYAHLNNLD